MISPTLDQQIQALARELGDDLDLHECIDSACGGCAHEQRIIEAALHAVASLAQAEQEIEHESLRRGRQIVRRRVYFKRPMLIAELLSRSRAAHATYRQLSAASKNTKTLEMGQAVQVALSARTDALLEDPERTDPAWELDEQAMRGATNGAMMDFYIRYLSPTEAYLAPPA